MKKIKNSLTFFLIPFFCLYSLESLGNKIEKKILISQVVEHPALDITTKGIVDGLNQHGFKRGVNTIIRIESAQANAALASQIAGKFVNQEPDLVVGVGTISAQSFSKYTKQKKVKLVFSSITDPVEAHIIQSLEKPRQNTSGVSNFVDLKPQIELFQKLQPTLKRIGILYNPGEINSVSVVKKLEALCLKLCLTLTKQTINKTGDIPQNTAKLANQVDAIFISNDNTALSGLQGIIRIATKAKVPVYVSDTDSVKLGALAALGPNQYELGIQTAELMARVLKGEDINTIPVEFPRKMGLYLNLKAAKTLEITIPQKILTKATRTF